MFVNSNERVARWATMFDITSTFGAVKATSARPKAGITKNMLKLYCFPTLDERGRIIYLQRRVRVNDNGVELYVLLRFMYGGQKNSPDRAKTLSIIDQVWRTSF